MPDNDTFTTAPDDARIDEMLRAAGARLRDLDVDVPTPRPVRRPTDRRRRWILPITLGAVAATIALIIGITSATEQTIEQVPTDTLAPVPSTPAPTTPPSPSTPTPTSTPTDDETGAPALPGPTVTVSEAGWDGPGSACLTIDDASGCVPAGVVTESGIVASAITSTGAFDVPLRLADGEIVVGDTQPVAEPEEAVANPRWLVHQSGPSTGAGVLYGVLPSAPTGEIAYEVVSFAGETLPLTLLTDVVEGADDGDTGFRVYETTVDLAGRAGGEGDLVRCVLVVPDDGSGWYESCGVPPGPDGGPGAVFVHDDQALLLDRGNTRLVALGDAPLRTNGCDTAVRDLLAAPIGMPVMISGLTCDEERDVASGRFGSVFVQEGPPDGGLVVWERDDTGAWSVADTGTGIEPDPIPFPIPPADVVLLDADAAATATADVTETIEMWMAEQPAATIAEAIAAGEAARSAQQYQGVELIVSTGFLPSLTAVEVTYLDDSVGGARYAVWTTEPDDGSDPVMSAFRWFLCSRGVTEADGAQLCV